MKTKDSRLGSSGCTAACIDLICSASVTAKPICPNTELQIKTSAQPSHMALIESASAAKSRAWSSKSTFSCSLGLPEAMEGAQLSMASAKACLPEYTDSPVILGTRDT